MCSRCIYDDTTPAIQFDQEGICNYCMMVDDLKKEYKTGTREGERRLGRIIDQIKKEGRRKKYDCAIGISGGTDSSYMVCWAVNNGLRPLAVHYDNTWNTAIATENIRKVLGKLNVDLYTHVIDNKESDDIFKAFFLAGVPEIEAATDLALAETLYRAAAQYKIKYVLEGHSFIAEGITPLGKNYFDGRYIKYIHRKYGTLPMKTYPLMTFGKFLKWTTYHKIKKIRPLWYMSYSKESARVFLENEFGWQYYGGHHLENRMTAFFQSIYAPQKFNIDYRNNSLSASVRAGIITRDEAIQQYYYTEPYVEPELVDYFKKRLNLNDIEYKNIMNDVPKYWYEFPTYKRRFEILRPFFYLLMKADLVPRSFYMKYCFPSENNR
ncbi:MAG: N-acetyl sugar amidotransferase [Bacteroidota bacterium]